MCDAGCGIGSLSISLAKLGMAVSASDISAAMVAEVEKQVRILTVFEIWFCVVVHCRECS